MGKNIKEIIYFALDEITAIDEEFRQNPISIQNPSKRRKAINRAFKATCDKFGIEYTDKDIKLEGEKQLKGMAELIKNSFEAE